jgi:predicted amidophosphoribosyltransferase
LEISTGRLKIIKHKKPQAKLNETERRENIKDCFVFEGENLAGRNILLVDDIATTGATLSEAARVLKENGAGQVWGLVVAKG